MENIIKEMIEYAEKEQNYEVAEMVYKILSEFAYTINCPSNWREMGEFLLKKYEDNDWIIENCKLYDFE